MKELFNLSEDQRTKIDMIANYIAMMNPIVCTVTVFNILIEVSVFRYIFEMILIFVSGAILYVWAIHLFLSSHYYLKEEEQGEEEEVPT